MNDSLANLLEVMSQFDNLGRDECTVKPASKLIKNVLLILKENGYIKDFKIVEDDKGDFVVVSLHGKINKCGVIKPRFSIKQDGFEKFEKRYLPAKDFGILIVSTSKGLMIHKTTKEKHLGGRLIAYCY